MLVVFIGAYFIHLNLTSDRGKNKLDGSSVTAAAIFSCILLLDVRLADFTSQ